MPEHVFLSAHLDDAVYSCGGLIHRQIRSGGSCTVLTVFAGDPSPGKLSDFAEALHERWGLSNTTVAARRVEDLAACSRLGAGAIHFDLPEAIYRRDEAGHPMYPSEEAIFGAVQPGDRRTIHDLSNALREVGLAGSQVYVPLALGGHVDHLILRAAAEALGSPLWFYRDLPYAMSVAEPSLQQGAPGGVESIQPLDAEDLGAWAEAAASYQSQISTFWDDADAMGDAFAAYLSREGGIHVVAPEATR